MAEGRRWPPQRNIQLGELMAGRDGSSGGGERPDRRRTMKAAPAGGCSTQPRVPASQRRRRAAASLHRPNPLGWARRLKGVSTPDLQGRDRKRGSTRCTLVVHPPNSCCCTYKSGTHLYRQYHSHVRETGQEAYRDGLPCGTLRLMRASRRTRAASFPATPPWHLFASFAQRTRSFISG